MQQCVKFTEFWHVFFAGTLIWYHTHKHIHAKTHSTPSDQETDIHVNTYLHQLLCAHCSYLYNIEWIIDWYQKFTFLNVFSSVQKLSTYKCHICWLNATRLGSSWET